MCKALNYMTLKDTIIIKNIVYKTRHGSDTELLIRALLSGRLE